MPPDLWGLPFRRHLFKSVVVSIVLQGCESCTLTADLERRIQVFEHMCCRRLLSISYTEHRTNEVVRQQVTNYAARQEPTTLPDRNQLRCQAGTNYAARQEPTTLPGRNQLRCQTGTNYAARQEPTTLPGRNQLRCQTGTNYAARQEPTTLPGRNQLRCQAGTNYAARQEPTTLPGRNQLRCQAGTNYAARQELLMATVKRRKLAWRGQISRQDSLAKIILQGTVNYAEADQ